MSASKQRVDRLLVERGLVDSRARARALVEGGKVRVAGALVNKASQLVDESAVLELSEPDHPYVSRGGLKLEGALRDLAFALRDLIVLDVGASTGGFTDCALRHGAARVYAFDVGHDQLHASLRSDARVIAREGVNARHLTPADLPERVQLIMVDASFISLTKLLPSLVPLMTAPCHMLALVKPQFEVGPEHLGKSGVVWSDTLRTQALDDVLACAQALGLTSVAHVDCRIPGPEGNREIFVLLRTPP